MAPLPLHLPTIEALLPLLTAGFFLAKRDWRHGFHHATPDIASRKYMGIRLSNRLIGCFVALPFGASQSPTLFSELVNEYARLLQITFQYYHLPQIILCGYIDDTLIAAPIHAQIQ
jgi:hypothetical protein